ncbi:hypothetical protein F5Y06DRAFT_84048 [Hypoxylon sp. FL0890]|nr:hypothetical protein F5Y06DRAFT_84048 [Hypoxylon sp. FL0890]
MGQAASDQRGNRGGCWNRLKLRDSFFKSPRDTTWTIDSAVNGRAKPSGYDTNSLITILRSSQCVAAIMTLILYVFTLSFPSFWLAILSSTTGFVSACFSILALYLRHCWTIWLVLPEVLITIAWIVLLVASAISTPKDDKYVTFHLGMIAIEASMVLWIQTGLLMITPFFHKLIPRLFGVKTRRNTGPDRSMDNVFELQSALPSGAATVPPGGMVYQSIPPPMASPQPTHAGHTRGRLKDVLAAQRASGAMPRLTTAIQGRPVIDTPSPAGPTTSVPFSVHPSRRSVSPVSTLHGSMHSISPVTACEDPRDINPWDTAPVRGGDVRQAHQGRP